MQGVGQAVLLLRRMDIVLSTLNAKYIHAAFGLRCLMANLGSLKERACLAEFEINQRPLDIAEVLLARNPKIIGFGVYIWNVAPTTQVIAAIKKIRPEIVIVLGGPEVSYEWDKQPIIGLADYVITGEADLKFRMVCEQLLSGSRPDTKLIQAELPEFSQLELPYDLYSEQDISHRVIYVEASRGCPFTCEFCLSSLEVPVRQAPLNVLLGHLEKLIERGVKQFKFVDRTFNLNLTTSKALLEFFLQRHQPGMFYHFEMIPDRLPEALRETIVRFPPGSLQFEVGIQSFNDEVCKLISRRQDLKRLEDNFHFLREQTGVHIHADLIVGLPGEDLESFAKGFDRLVRLRPQEIQIGILKRLRGTPIIRHDSEWQMLYSSHPPYEILQNRLLDFGILQQLRRLARYWDLVGNSGNFLETTPLLWRNTQSPFEGFFKWSQWLFERVGRTDSIALARLAELLFNFLVSEGGIDRVEAAETLWRDYQRGGHHEVLEFLKPYILAARQPRPAKRSGQAGMKRQVRHLGAA